MDMLSQATGSGLPILIILAVLSLLSLTVIVAKVLQLWSARSGSAARASAVEAWSKGRKEDAKGQVALAPGPASRVLAQAMVLASGPTPRSAVEAELTRLGNAEVATMNRYIRLLELVAMISPLLGLLGTVLGMIQSFQELELAEGAANAAVLAGGIWQALLTTAAGLVVAIPAAAGAVLLSTRVESAAQMIESAVGQFFLAEDRAY